ncbi:MAG: hypothetical protein RLY46_1831, partial [Bacteroidota bacterium]
MLNAAFDIHFNKYADAAELSQIDQQVIGQARKLTSSAYA